MTDHPLAIEALTQGATVRLVLRGELEQLTAPALDQAVEQLRAQGIRHLIVDLRDVALIDSTGLHALADLDASARRNGHNTSFVRARGSAWRALAIVGMAEQLVWVDHPDELSSPTDTAAHRQAGADLGSA